MCAKTQLRKPGIVLILLSVLLILPAPAVSETEGDTVESHLSEMSLEELMALEVTSVSKKSERYADAAAALYVLTGEDIRRSGIIHLADALRLVPGLQVARIDANSWAVSSRGFNSRFSNKLLVLIDGRAVYTPMYSGVYWDVQDVPIEFIDRIEVIRGPGGTLWGANAVNGVINIITRDTLDAERHHLSLGGGSGDDLFASASYGGRMGEQGAWRAYVRGFDYGPLTDAAGDDAFDGWNQVRAGFRTDWSSESGDQFTVQGDLYDGESDKTLVVPVPAPPFYQVSPFEGELSGYNLLGRWSRERANGSRSSLQFFFDHTERDLGINIDKRSTSDLEYTSEHPLNDRHTLIWGLGYRLSVDDFINSPTVTVVDDPDDLEWWNGFIQDEIRLRDGAVRLVLGTKLEHNSYTGYEVSPNFRLAWHLDDYTTFWAALSRSLRTPSRASSDVIADTDVDSSTGTLIRILPNPDSVSEELLALEAGIHLRASENLSMDFATFYNDYSHLATTQMGAPFVEFDPPPPHGVVPIMLIGGGNGTAYGLEVTADYRVKENWRLVGGLTWLRLEQELDQPDPTATFRDTTELNPEFQMFVRSSFDLSRRFGLDLILRHVGELPEAGILAGNRAAIDAYTALDVQLDWRPADSFSLSLVGRDLLEKEHLEFVDNQFLTPQTRVDRRGYIRATWRF